MVSQKRGLLLLAALLVLVVGFGISVYTWSNPLYRPSPRPLLPGAPEYVCLEEQTTAECAQLKLTCGNGVIDPGEDCHNCPLDSGCAEGLVCGNTDASEDYVCHYPKGFDQTSPGN
jgi:hypothetical protein